MEGLISLGIYTRAGKLIRVLHRAAKGDEFVAALDGYITHWDGLDDTGHPAPPGHYTARGYMIGDVTVRHLDTSSPPPAPLTFPNGKPFLPKPKIHVTLVSNPLDQDRPGAADLAVTLGPDGSWLQLADGLPLKQIDPTPANPTDPANSISMGRAAPGDPLIVFTHTPALQSYSITNISHMMAFDCGDFDLDK
jgi:hypothetical protein